MTTRDHNPLLALYGVPRAVVHSRVSVRAKPVAAESEQTDADRIGNAMISLIGLKDQKPTSR